MIPPKNLFIRYSEGIDTNAGTRLQLLQIGLKIDNILNAKTESVYKSFKADEQFFTKLAPAMHFTFRMRYSLF